MTPPESPNSLQTYPVYPQGAISDVSEDPRVVKIVQEYFERLKAGEQPRQSDYVCRLPELSEQLKACLQGLDLVYGATAMQSAIRGALTASLAHEPATGQLGDFRIEREVGRGGMGVVYEATQISLRRRVALKVLSFASTLHKKQLQRFVNEAQAAAHLHHNNIVPVFAVGSERGIHYYAMQFIDGLSLAELIAHLRQDAEINREISDGSSASDDSATTSPPSNGSFRDDQPERRELTNSTIQLSRHVSTLCSENGHEYFHTIAEWIRQTAEALAYAHDLGIVHRDIKPANLMLDAGNHIWVTDFGLAHIRAADDLTQTGDLLGTLRYMSPEQAAGERQLIDHRADIYSLGATLYELTTLRPVYDDRCKESLLQSVIAGQLTLPRRLNRHIPVDLETVILKATSRLPQDRYTSAAVFADDLKRFIDDKPILARRPSVAERVKRWSRRHSGIVAAAFALLVAISAALAVHNRMIATEQEKTAQSLLRERQRAREAEQRFQQARNAVEVLITTSEEDLSYEPRLFATRKHLLETAVAYYEDFIRQQRHNPATQKDLVSVQLNLKTMIRALGTLQVPLQLMLLENPHVQRDLNLSDQQRTSLTAMLQQVDATRSELIGREQDKGSRGLIQRHLLESAEKHQAQLTAILSTSQLDRLSQVLIQHQGVFAFQQPEISRALNLTAKQRDEIRDIMLGSMIARAPRPKLSSSEFRIEKSTVADERAMAEILARLTPEQARKWQALHGPQCEGLDILSPLVPVPLRAVGGTHE